MSPSVQQSPSPHDHAEDRGTSHSDQDDPLSKLTKIYGYETPHIVFILEDYDICSRASLLAAKLKLRRFMDAVLRLPYDEAIMLLACCPQEDIKELWQKQRAGAIIQNVNELLLDAKATFNGKTSYIKKTLRKLNSLDKLTRRVVKCFADSDLKSLEPIISEQIGKLLKGYDIQSTPNHPNVFESLTKLSLVVKMAQKPPSVMSKEDIKASLLKINTGSNSQHSDPDVTGVADAKESNSTVTKEETRAEDVSDPAPNSTTLCESPSINGDPLTREVTWRSSDFQQVYQQQPSQELAENASFKEQKDQQWGRNQWYKPQPMDVQQQTLQQDHEFGRFYPPQTQQPFQQPFQPQTQQFQYVPANLNDGSGRGRRDQNGKGYQNGQDNRGNFTAQNGGRRTYLPK